MEGLVVPISLGDRFDSGGCYAHIIRYIGTLLDFIEASLHGSGWTTGGRNIPYSGLQTIYRHVCVMSLYPSKRDSEMLKTRFKKRVAFVPSVLSKRVFLIKTKFRQRSFRVSRNVIFILAFHINFGRITRFVLHIASHV